MCLQVAIFFRSYLYIQQSKAGNVYIFVIGDVQSFASQVFGVVGPLEENLDIFSPSGSDIQRNSDHKTQKIKLYSVRALKYYLNEKNLTHGRVIATISKLMHRFLKRALIHFNCQISKQFVCCSTVEYRFALDSNCISTIFSKFESSFDQSGAGIKDDRAFSLLHQDFSQILVLCLPWNLLSKS